MLKTPRLTLREMSRADLAVLKRDIFCDPAAICACEAAFSAWEVLLRSHKARARRGCAQLRTADRGAQAGQPFFASALPAEIRPERTPCRSSAEQNRPRPKRLAA